MSALAEAVIAELHRGPEGVTVTPKQFFHLGSRAAVDQTFSRLVKTGSLIRVGRALYSTPVVSRFGTHPPAVEKLLEHLHATTGEIVVSHPARAANDLGLTEQVPIRDMYLTSGTAKQLQVGSRIVDLVPGKRWQLMWGDDIAGHAVRALGWGDRKNIAHRVSVVRQILDPTKWERIYRHRSALPGWMAMEIGRQGAHDTDLVGPHRSGP